ncbi:PIN domain-containing protein [Treponema primitia]|uniref:PIN domain-containing protein n=1 Tax=Treponema primitia TaxID=88058 RepID=UPI0002555390|nr:PIN domain-containing protein [Treponema primitia]
MTDRIFVDSNVWVYFFVQDEYNKYKIAGEYFSKNANNSVFIITYQVINETTNQLIKNKISEKTIKENIEYMYKICTIQDFSKNIILSASKLRELYSFSFWDSIIAASAIESNSNILASEDMQDGLKINNTTIKNIFKI